MDGCHDNRHTQKEDGVARMYSIAIYVASILLLPVHDVKWVDFQHPNQPFIGQTKRSFDSPHSHMSQRRFPRKVLFTFLPVATTLVEWPSNRSNLKRARMWFACHWVGPIYLALRRPSLLISKYFLGVVSTISGIVHNRITILQSLYHISVDWIDWHSCKKLLLFHERKTVQIKNTENKTRVLSGDKSISEYSCWWRRRLECKRQLLRRITSVIETKVSTR